MKLRQVASAVLSLALILSAVTVAGTKKLQAAGEHSITVNAISATYANYVIDGVTDRHGPIDMAGGTIDLTKYSAEEGEKIEVSANPKAGYALDFVLVGNGAAGTDITAQESLDFTMPDEDVIIDVKFRAVEGADPEYGAFFTTTEAYGTMDAKICADTDEANGFLLPEPTFDCPDDKMFVGWVNTDDGELYAPGANVPIPQGGLLFIADYKDFNIQAIFTPGEHGTGTMDPQVLTKRSDAAAWKFPECGFDGEDGYCFDHWDLVGTTYYPGDPLSLELDAEYMAFEAVWKPLENTCYVVSAGALNVRQSPTKESPRVGGLHFGKAFDATSEKIVNGEKWIRLKYNGDEGPIDGWVAREFLYLTYTVDTAIEPQKVTVTAGALNVRSAPEKIDDPSNRITGVTAGKEILVTGYLDNGTEDESDDWLVIDIVYEGVHRLGFVMAKYTEGVIDKKEIVKHSLDLSGSIPTGYSLTSAAAAAVAAGDSAVLDLSNFTSEGNGLFTVVIYPDDACTFSELEKENISIDSSLKKSVMDMVRNEDGSIALTLSPIDPVKVTFMGLDAESNASELLSRYISSGETVTKPDEDPTLEGATFTGWFEDEECTIPFDFSKAVSGDISIFSGFKLNEEKSTEPTTQESETVTEPEENPEVTEPQVTYTVKAESDKVVRGSGNPFVITVKRSVDDAELCFQLFRGVSIDGKPLVKDQNYTAEKGSTIITILPEPLEALSDGTHTITVEFADGKTEFTFTLAQPDAETNTENKTEETKAEDPTSTPAPAKNGTGRPKTGDVGSSTRTAVIAILALCAIASIVLMDRRKKNEEE